MEKINIAELLKDCPKGMELDCTMFENVTFVRVDMSRKQFPIEIAVSGIRSKYLTKEGCFHDITLSPESKCVIFPKGKTTWEGFVPPCQFKEGDVVCTSMDSIAILGDRIGEHSESFNSYCGLFNYEFDFNVIVLPERLATEEEKAMLFQVIKDNGYKWNAETKTLEKLPKFKNGDVIVCENHWGPFISIFKENVTERNGFIGHCVLDLDDNKFKVKDSASYFNEVRFATKREKELLFVAIERNGYQWNSETNTLEKLIEPRFDITTLVPFKSEVLVRNDEHQYWIPAFWGFKEKSGYTTTFGWCKYCIPYEGNEHLLGKTNNCDEHFKTWE